MSNRSSDYKQGFKAMVYILEDDNSIRELVCYSLNSAGIEAEGYARPSEFWAAIQKKRPELVMLDIMLPEEDGLTVLKKLRSETGTEKLPIMVLSAKDGEYDKVLGLNLGADDYIAKPFGMMELIARVKALLRRVSEQTESPYYETDILYVHPARHVVKVAGEEIALTLKEFEMLCLLLQNKGIVMTRDNILSKVWGYSFDGENRTVDVHIRSLRGKLGKAGKLIETVRGIGYKIAGE